MNKEYWQNLGRRAVSCKAWRWMPGMMAAESADRVLIATTRAVTVDCIDGNAGYCAGACAAKFERIPLSMFSETPDLRDPATLGCLLALVREAWGNPLMFVTWTTSGWLVVSRSHKDPAPLRCQMPEMVMRKDTEAAALLDALEAAP